MSVTKTLPDMTRWQQYHALTKPKVVQLIVFCAFIGMVLAVPSLPTLAQLQRMAIACLGTVSYTHLTLPTNREV